MSASLTPEEQHRLARLLHAEILSEPTRSALERLLVAASIPLLDGPDDVDMEPGERAISVCCQAYQVIGVLSSEPRASDRVSKVQWIQLLDLLSDAGSGRPLQTESCLPFLLAPKPVR
jgi:hypothetical protein